MDLLIAAISKLPFPTIQVPSFAGGRAKPVLQKPDSPFAKREYALSWDSKVDFRLVAAVLFYLVLRRDRFEELLKFTKAIFEVL